MEISLTGDQMLTVLETVGREGPVSAANVAKLCDINRTVAHRLLTTLAERAYVRREEGGYTLGPALFHLARGMDTDLHRIAKPIMQRLASETGETVVLHAIANNEAVVVDQALGQKHLVRVEHRPGSRHCLLQGASGWSLIAFQDAKVIERVLKKAGASEEARSRIGATRKEGYAISRDELQLGVHGVAVPIVEQNGSCEASLAILVPASRGDALLTHLKPLQAAAADISRLLA